MSNGLVHVNVFEVEAFDARVRAAMAEIESSFASFHAAAGAYADENEGHTVHSVVDAVQMIKTTAEEVCEMYIGISKTILTGTNTISDTDKGFAASII